MKQTLQTSTALRQACSTYAKNQATQTPGQPWDKQKDQTAVFDAAKKQFGKRLVYAEACAASHFFHVRIPHNKKKATVFELTLLEEHRAEHNDFKTMNRSTWANK